MGKRGENRRHSYRLNMNYLTSVIGFLAAILTTVAFVPQILKIWRARSAKDISLGMYTAFTIGVALWLAYGILIDSWPIILANCVTLLLAGGVLVMKMKLG